MVAAGVASLAARIGSPVLCAQDTDVASAATIAARSGGSESASSATGGLAAAISRQTRRAVEGSTRTAQGLLALATPWRDAVVVIGNAPTALLALLDAVADGVAPPAALIATPCGLVAAAEAKQLLLDDPPCPAITIRGTRGGSAVAAAAFNACAILARDAVQAAT
jgi:precorrin-8X/cobalt-precorrin-8 methylmutase